ncbi:SMI1/KNR4 family protein [Planococcus halocryophilus]|uniref:SMI1/KNR4 family protein n=1 Tax=Planococcus halocryophilus TaxID=1215089 RepID=UPI001F0E1988|nr:SMI1/KNR4 family protein [Planococcus halocryophilus]MCH4827513.1 SMI1/KNR4 family protein [Planococcus halocryophilus]
MDTSIQQYLKSLDLNDPADPNVIRNVENQLGFQFPKEYFKFLLHSNGGEGPIGDNFLQLWKVEELIEDNEGYSVEEFAPGLWIIGSDGGDTAYCLDTRSKELPFVSMPFIGMDLDEVEVCGSTFHEFLKILYTEPNAD